MKFLILLIFIPLMALGEDIKLLTWNVYMLPKPINFTKQKERSGLIADEMLKTDHDIIFFQEAFTKGFRNEMKNRLKEKYPYQEHLRKSRRLLHFINSGLLVMSRYPFEVLGWVYFNNCVHSDCLSSKGAMLIEVEIRKDKRVQFVMSHMQAWDDQKAVSARIAQVEEIKTLLDLYKKPGIPQLLVGDLNIDGRLDTEYPAALKKLDMTSSPLDGEILTTNGFKVPCYKIPSGLVEGQWLDHIWLRSNNSEAQVQRKMVIPFKAIMQSGKECSLSDHYAVEAILRL